MAVAFIVINNNTSNDNQNENETNDNGTNSTEPGDVDKNGSDETSTEQLFDVILVSTYPGGASLSGGGSYSPGDIVHVNATISHGYAFVGWFKNNALFSSSQNCSFTAAGLTFLQCKMEIIKDASFAVIITDSTNFWSGEGDDMVPDKILTVNPYFNVEIASQSWHPYISYSTIEPSSYNTATFSVGVQPSLLPFMVIDHEVTYTDGSTAKSTWTYAGL